MDIVVDTSALIAVIAGEPEREGIIKRTAGHTLIGPGCIPWELGNTYSAMLKRRRIPLKDALRALKVFDRIPLRYLAVDMPNALSLAERAGVYAYDAYFLDCAIRYGAPLLTLDRRLRLAAQKLGLAVLEV